MLGVLILLLALALAACGGDTPTNDQGSQPPSGEDDRSLTIMNATVDEPAVPVDQAPDATDQPLRVVGALFVDVDGTVRLCSAIAESFPPQCAGERLLVRGLDLASLDLEEANGVRWAERVELVGTIS